MKQFVFYKIVSFLTLAVLFTACEKDYYQPKEGEKKSISDIFGIDFTIPDGFDWSTLQTSPITVKVDDQYNGAKDYTIEVLADNPIVTPNARLLKKVTIRGNKTLETSVTYPKANAYIYVRQTNPEGRQVVKFMNTTQSVLEADFSASSVVATKSSVSTRSMELRSETTFTEPTETSEGAIEIDITQNSISLEAGKKYVIKEDYTGTINFAWDENTYLFIEGSWTNNTSDISIYKTKLIVKEGGRFIHSGNLALENSKFYNYGNTSISGKITGYIASQVTNKGILKAKEFSIFQGKILNQGDLTITDTLYSDSPNFYLKNQHIANIKSIKIQGTIDNDGLIIVDENVEVPTNFTLNIGSGALFKAREFSSIGNSRIDIASNGILEVTDFINISNTEVTISGATNSLARLKEIRTAEDWVKPKFTGYLEVESSKYEDPKSGKYDVEITVDFVPEGRSTVTIPPNKNLNEGGNNPGNGNTEGETDGGPRTMGYTYAFEDSYPQLGDYDVNDLVLYIETSLIEASENIRSLTIKATVKAAGATIGLGAAIQLTNVDASTISSVTRNGDISLTGSTFTTSNGIESDQSKAVIPLFDEVHEVFGVDKKQMINTIANSQRITPKTVILTITFNQDVTLTMENLDVFVVNGGSKNKRKEIHLPHFSPTEKAQPESNGYISNGENLVWGISFPGEFKYPLEYTNIISAYPDFQEHAKSGGQENKDWYHSPVSGKVYE